MQVRSLICTAALTLSLSGGAQAARSLEQVRYALFQDSQAQVEEDLRHLTERGDLGATRLLGEVLASRSPGNAMQAITLFKQAFADGRGDIGALIPLARLVDYKPRLREANRTYIRQALERFATGRDFIAVDTRLEVFLVYPELFQLAEVARLIELYDRACLMYCHAPLYRAVAAVHKGDQADAEKWFKLAVESDTRAVYRYYEFLGEERNLRFRAFASQLIARMQVLPVDLVHRIGQQLTNVRNAEISAYNNSRPQTRAENEEEQQAREQKAKAHASLVEQLDREVLQWLDHAIERDFGPAMLSKAGFLMTAPDRYSPEPVEALIQRLEQRQGENLTLSMAEREQPITPQRIKALRVSLHLVLWRTLDPLLSQRLIAELQAENYAEALLLEGDLYSQGVLDEPDQDRALALYMQEAKQGSANALLRIARLYTNGRAICRDNAKAYAFAYAAHELGDQRATDLMLALQSRITPQQRDVAIATGNRLIEESAL
ncbi:MAG: sel1 repeat family protein [Pseudomonas sp.]|uniref:sel1 repeat family protein n=1 Tax=Pseudomonas sp. TaxID=306 RepID=UPI002718F112|nr:sel1 repeat family protein [Pseudomonas sp.]MDO9618367.1 sel1 repeat family protein [Pseudomonas sp.]MDP2445986.1 sel1 repeat family protein [Pseudomonas sp.]MDZ4337757.1 sel1 repeat family protein [Pseudomonas sp.]